MSDCTTEDITEMKYTQGTAATGIERSADVLSKIREDKKDTLTDEVVSKLTSNIEKVNVYESAEIHWLLMMNIPERISLIPFSRHIKQVKQVMLQR